MSSVDSLLTCQYRDFLATFEHTLALDYGTLVFKTVLLLGVDVV